MSIINKLLRDDKSGLIEENDDGNIEYKWKLDSKTELTLKKLTSQLLWRLNEGKELYGTYEAHYILGIFDNGNLGMLSLDELNITIDIFKSVIEKVYVEITNSVIEKINNSYIYCATIRYKPIDKKINEINIMFCGAEQVGKSSIISHLCYSNRDNGNGGIRDYVMTHEHEKIMGQTMCINKQIIGIKNDKILNYNYSQNWEEIVKISDKIINIYDTPGNKKYFKTILKALRTYMIDVLFIVTDKNHKRDKKDIDDEFDEFDEFDEYTSFLIDYATRMKIKYYLIKSKRERKSKLNNLNTFNPLHTLLNISSINPDLSDMDKVKQILIESNKNNNYVCFIPNTFRITSIYNIPDRNKIVAGIQTTGTLTYNSNCYIIFPDLNFKKINIESIFKKNIDSIYIYEKETGSLSISLHEALGKGSHSISLHEALGKGSLSISLHEALGKGSLSISQHEALGKGSISYKNNNTQINQITKDCIITDEKGIEYIKNINTKSIKLNILKMCDIPPNFQNIKYYLINCNVSYIVNITTYNNIYINIEFNMNILLQDNICILMPVEIKDFNQIIICELFN